MDTVGKLIAAVLLCSVICLLLKKQAPELTLCLCMLLCVLCFLTSLPFFSPVLAFFHRLADMTGLSGAVFAPLFKTAAIGILAQLAGTICRDSGQQARAGAGGRDLLRLCQLLSGTAASGTGSVPAANDDRRLICGAV